MEYYEGCQILLFLNMLQNTSPAKADTDFEQGKLTNAHMTHNIWTYRSASAGQKKVFLLNGKFCGPVTM